MQRAATNDAISRAVSDINAIPSSDLKSRASVSQGVVLRLLNAAGWDVFDLSQVMPGYRSANTEIGYALLMPRSGSGESPSPQVLVEVRSPGESLEAARTVNRLLGCCASVGAPLGVLTDGLQWRLFLHTAGENRRGGSFCDIDLGGNQEAAAEDVDRYLSRERVASGQAVRSAERLLRDRNRDETSRQAIMEGWRQVVGGMDDGLLSLVATAAEQRTGLRPDNSLVRRVLSDSRAELLASGADRVASAVPHSRTRPSAFTLGTETRSVSSWGGLLVEVCLMMRDFHPGDFGRIVEIRGRTTPYFSRVADELREPRPIGDTGIFASCQGSGALLASRAAGGGVLRAPAGVPGHQRWVTVRGQDARIGEAVAGGLQRRLRGSVLTAAAHLCRNSVNGCLQALYKLGVKPSAHAEAEDIIIGMFGSEGEQWGGPPAG